MTENQNDCYAILQLRDDAEDFALKIFSSVEELKKMGKKPQIVDYRCVNIRNFRATNIGASDEIQMLLESLYETYQFGSAGDYARHSLSVSDVIALKLSGKISFHFVDSIGFKELPDFMWQDSCLMVTRMFKETKREKHPYMVTIRVEGSFVANVEAESIEEAIEQAKKEFKNTSFGDLREVSGNVTSVDDEEGLNICDVFGHHVKQEKQW